MAEAHIIPAINLVIDHYKQQHQGQSPAFLVIHSTQVPTFKADIREIIAGQMASDGSIMADDVRVRFDKTFNYAGVRILQSLDGDPEVVYATAEQPVDSFDLGMEPN